MNLLTLCTLILLIFSENSVSQQYSAISNQNDTHEIVQTEYSNQSSNSVSFTPKLESIPLKPHFFTEVKSQIIFAFTPLSQDQNHFSKSDSTQNKSSRAPFFERSLGIAFACSFGTLLFILVSKSAH